MKKYLKIYLKDFKTEIFYEPWQCGSLERHVSKIPAGTKFSLTKNGCDYFVIDFINSHEFDLCEKYGLAFRVYFKAETLGDLGDSLLGAEINEKFDLEIVEMSDQEISDLSFNFFNIS